MKKYIYIVISCFLLFSCSDILQDLDMSKNFVKYEADYDREAFTQKQGPIADSEIVINGEKIPYTSSSVVIPEGYHEDICSVNENHYTPREGDSDSDSLKGAFPPGRKVRLTAFEMSQFEVSQRLYKAVMGEKSRAIATETYDSSTDRYFIQYPQFIGDDLPIVMLDFVEIIVFCNKLTEMTMGKEHIVYYADQNFTIPYSYEHGGFAEGWPSGYKPRNENEPSSSGIKCEPFMNPAKKGYRLPTVAEWEYAARGANPSNTEVWNAQYGCTNDYNDIWCEDSRAGNKNHLVNSKKANPIGLYNMCGNASEYCWDKTVWKAGEGSLKHFITHDEAYLDVDGYILNPRGNTWTDKQLYADKSVSFSNYRCTMGRSHYQYAWMCRVYWIGSYSESLKNTEYGFRICRTL